MASSLGDMVVRIVGDNSEFDSSIDKSAKKFKSMQQIVAEGAADLAKSFKQLDGEAALWGNSVDILKQKQDALKKEMSRLIAEGIDPTGKETEKLMDQYYDLGNEITRLEKKQVSLKDKLSDFGSSAQKIGGKLSLFVTAPLLAIGAAAIKSSAEMEMLEASFTTMLGSAEKAKSLMEDLKQLAAVTPFETTSLAESTKTLLQFGIEGDKVVDTLKMLGDISGGNSAKLSSLALVFGQISSTGRLMGQDLLQLINVGFNPLQVISEKTGKSMAELKKDMEKGAISADQVTAAFVSATSEGGKFYKGMETASKTLSGVFSTLKDDVGALSRSFSDDYLPAIKEVIKSISSIVQGFTTMDSATRANIVTIGLAATALGPLISVVGSATKAIAAFNASLLLNPVVLITTGVIALAASLVIFTNNLKSAQVEQEKLNKIMAGGTTGDLKNDLNIVNGRIEKINALIGNSTGLIEGENDELVKELESLKKIKSDLAEKNKWQAMNLRGQEALNKAATIENLTQEEINKALAVRAKVEERYKNNRTIVLSILEDEKTEYQKIQDQIDKLANSPWAKGELEDDRIKALEILRKRQLDIITEAKERLRAGEEANTEVIKSEAGKRALALAEIEKSDLAQQQARLATIQQFIDLSKTETQLRLEDIEKQKEAFIAAGVSEVEANDWAIKQIINIRLDQFSKILSSTGSFVSTLQNLYTMDTENKLDAINTQLTAALAAVDKELQEKLKAEGLAAESAYEAALKEVQAAENALAGKLSAIEEEKKAIQDKEDAVLEAIDIEEQAKLYSLGLTGPATLDQYDAEIAKAIEAGDLESAAELQKARDKLAIQLEYNLQRTAQEAAAQAELDRIDNEAALKEAERSAEKAKLEEEAAEKKKKLEKQAALDTYKVEKSAFYTNQQLSITNAIIAGLEGAIEAYKALAGIPIVGPGLGVAAAAAIATFASTQVNLIRQQQPPSPPALAEGGIVMPRSGGTLTTVAEAGQPEVVFPLDKLSNFLSGNNRNSSGDGNIQIVVNLDSKPFLEKIFPATRNRTVLISQGAVI